MLDFCIPAPEVVMMRIVSLSLSVLLSSFGTRALAATATFDTPSQGIGRVLETIHIQANQMPTPPSAPANKVLKPIILAISGLHPEEIGIGLEFRHILELWKWVFPGKIADEKKIRAELEQMHLELNEIERESASTQEHENTIENEMRKVVEERKLNIDVEGFDWSRDMGDTFTAIPRLVKRLKELESRAQGRPIHIICHSWGTVIAHSALARIAHEGHPIQVESFVTMGSPLVPVNLMRRIFGQINQIEEVLQARVKRPKGVGRWINLLSQNDPFAGTVNVADDNIRVDRHVDAYEAKLTTHLESGASRWKIWRDRRALRNGIRWHLSYTNSFKAIFAVLQEEIEWPIFRENAGTILLIVETNTQ